ncbi:2-deoxy-scyllo-inosamine dehydrogenase [Planctomycetes bacterium Pla86]|uniref:2-deoxy-scyllo-inosamine dehydrogenase n=2 Tax=Engelhardtia mirabilis TaxID=2528011 RepID=A0A518BKN6_9BACT|nr:2-deoxy-scyllo-inosamine dehydrogenase [Planctomycetes bacterium Pla133]QDV01861.1 2-deoxy-scyllo-inosamine dehydrogenase [Planctomycetes bacterium Pla86]
MRALVLGDGAPRVDRRPRPEAVRGETRVRVLLAGVCATDLALAQGYMGFKGVPGHEFVGLALDGPLEGRRVVGEINAGCGTCGCCRAGDPRHCESRSVLGILGRDGAFAEELRLPHGNLVEVPDGVDDDAATFTEPLAAALALLDCLGDARPERALVVGDGRLGLLCAWALADVGINVDLLGRHPERGAWAGERVRHMSRPLDDRPPPRRYPLVVEACGRTDAVARALAWTAPRGTLVLKTTGAEPVLLDLAPLVVDEIRLVGSRCGRFEPALAALAQGRLDPRALIEGRYPLEQAPLALEHAARGGVLKILVDITP